MAFISEGFTKAFITESFTMTFIPQIFAMASIKVYFAYPDAPKLVKYLYSENAFYFDLIFSSLTIANASFYAKTYLSRRISLWIFKSPIN